MKNVTETEIVEQCTESTREDCHPETSQQCVEKCKQVEVMIPTQVTEPVCREKPIKECRDKTIWVREFSKFYRYFLNSSENFVHCKI